MPAHDPLHDDLRSAYARLLGRRGRRRRLALAAAVAAVGATLAGLAVSNHATAPANAGAPGNDQYIACLNDHGWPVRDGLSVDPNGTAPDPATIDAAVAACADFEHGILDSLRPSDGALQQLTDQSSRFAACMRDHGADVGTPNVFRNRVGIGVTFPGYSAAAGSGSFDDAYSACRPIMAAFG